MAGVDSIEHGSFLSEETLSLMKEKETYLVPTLLAGEWTGGFGSRFFWLELFFLLGVLGFIVIAARKKRLRLMLVVTGVFAAAVFWLGTILFT